MMQNQGCRREGQMVNKGQVIRAQEVIVGFCVYSESHLRLLNYLILIFKGSILLL